MYIMRVMQKKINEFILNNDFDEILVHCTAGISRSPAVMSYIDLILDDKKNLI